MLDSLINLASTVYSKITAGEVMTVYAAVKVFAAGVRAKVAKEAAKVEAAAYTDAHKVEAEAKGAEVAVKSYTSYVWDEIKKAL